MKYYKVDIMASSNTISKDGEVEPTDNCWDENINDHFKTIEEAEQYIIDTFDLKKFEFTDSNGFDELQGGYEEIEEGKKFYIDQSISITEHVVTNVKFKKLKEAMK